MKKFWKNSKFPLLVSIIACGLYIFDALIGGYIVPGGSFMWVSFIFWTIFFGSSVKDRIKAFIGAVIGFISAIVMMLITNSFNLNLHTISISCLIGVFVVNLLVMYLDKADKLWLNSISGIFASIALTFSGLGVGLNPISSVPEAFTMLGIILLYGVMGLLAGFLCTLYKSKVSKQEIKKEKEENNPLDKN